MRDLKRLQHSTEIEVNMNFRPSSFTFSGKISKNLVKQYVLDDKRTSFYSTENTMKTSRMLKIRRTLLSYDRNWILDPFSFKKNMKFKNFSFIKSNRSLSDEFCKEKMLNIQKMFLPKIRKIKNKNLKKWIIILKNNTVCDRGKMYNEMFLIDVLCCYK